MKNSTFSAQVANNLLTLLQGYSKTIRLLLVMFLTLTVTTNAWGAGAWTLVTDASTLAAEDQVVIVAKDYNYALSSTQNSNNRGQAAVVKSDNTLTFNGSVQTLTLKTGKSAGTLAFYTGNGYLYAASSSKNYLKTETTLSANSSWTITIANTGVATIKATGSNTRNWLRYNSTNNPPIFSCYGSGQGDVCLYKYVEEQGGDEGGGETPDPCTTPTVAWNTQPANGEVGGSMTASVTTNYSNGLTYSSSNQTVATITDAGFINYLSAGNTTITATVTGDGTTFCEGPVSVQQEITVTAPAGGGGDDDADTWTLVKNVNDLAAGDQVVIAASSDNYALSTTQNSNNRGRAAVTKNGETITFGNDVQVLTLQTGNVSNSFALYTGSGYLYAASSSKNYLRTETSLSNNSSWSIAITNAGVATITAQGTNTNNLLRYNSSSSIFSCYSSGQGDVSIYKKGGSGGGGSTPDPDPIPVTSVSLDKTSHTMNEGETVTLTATVLPANADDPSVSWESDNEAVAKVNTNGIVTAVSPGTATITVTTTDGGKTATCAITVKPLPTVEGTWTLVTNTANLKAGDHIVIAAAESDFALSTTQNTNNRGQAAVTKKGNNITFTGATQIITLEAGTVDNTLAFNTGDGYLYAASSGSNHLKTQDTNNDNGSWSISIDNTGVATVVAKGSNTRSTMQYNKTNGLFACYETASQQAIAIYKEGGGTSTYTITSTLSHVTADGGNPTTITSEAEDLTLSYSAESGWNLPDAISVTMGGNQLMLNDEYTWDKETGKVWIVPANGFTGNIVVTINGWQQLATPTGLDVTNTTSTSATLSWGEVANASSYLVTIVDGGDLSADIPNTQTSHTFEGLTPSTEYLWTVTAIGDGTTYTDSEESETAEFTTPAAATPTAGYTIIHSRQALDDSYPDSLIVRTTGTAEVGSTITAEKKTYNGFVCEDEVQTITIQADAAQNVVTYKYVRQSYTLTWDLDGGNIIAEGTPAGTVKYGAPLTAPTVEKAGYRFDHWYPDVPATMQDGNRTYKAFYTQQHTVKWVSQGTVIRTDTYDTGAALEAAPTTGIVECDGKNHVGWTAQGGYANTTAPADLFTESSGTVTADATYYAVYAEGSGGGGTGWTAVTSTSDLEAGATYAISNAATGGTYLSTYTGGNNFPASTTTICPLILGGSEGAWTFQIADGGTYNDRFLTATNNLNNNYLRAVTTADDYSVFTISFDDTNKNAVIKCTGKGTRNILRKNSQSALFACYSSGQDDVYLQKLTGGGGYTNYTTSCATITGIRIEGERTTFNQFDPFEFGGKVFAIDDEDNETDVTELATFTGYDMSQAGTQTVTVRYSGCSVTYEITVNKLPVWNITWSVGGKTDTGIGPKKVVQGKTIGECSSTGDLQTPSVDCEGKVFMGWTESNTVPTDGVGIAYIDKNTKPDSDKTYYAVFAKKEVGDGVALTQCNGSTTFEAGDNIVIVASGADWSYLCYQETSGTTYIVNHEFVNNATTLINDDKNYWTLETANGGFYLGDVTNGYMYLPSSNDLCVDKTNKSIWTIEWDADTCAFNIKSDRWLSCRSDLSTANKYKWRGGGTDGASGTTNLQIYKISGSTSYTNYSTSCGTYTVTFYGFNSGGYTTTCNDNPAVDEVEQGGTYVIPNCEPTFDPAKLGRTFAGTWNTQANGKGTAYEPGDEFIVNSDITLYAQWALNTSENTTLPTDVEDLATTDIVVNGGHTLTLQADTTTINSLTLKGGLLVEDDSVSGYAMPVVNIPTGATLVRKNTTINLDLVVNSKSWYPFAVPFAATINANVEYLDSTLAAASKYGTHFAIKTYDGARRAEEGVDQTNNWVQLNRNEKLQPGVGYIISALTYPDKDTATIRIPMTVDNAWLANGELTTVNEVTRNAVAVAAHTGAAATEHQRHAGWNFVANPYLSNFAGSEASNKDGSFITGELLIDKGEYYYDRDDDVPYVTIPTYNFAHYYQVKLSDATLSPAYSFFVQVGDSGTMTFGRQQAPASIAARNAEERPVKMDVDITLSDNHSSDQTGIIISDRYNDTYEIGRDLEKLFGSAYNLSVYTLMADNTPLAYQALAIRSNMQVIPVGYRAPEQGEYTFRLNEATSSIDLLNEQYEQLVLVDYQTGELTNLLISDYTFYSERTQADNRFAIYAVPRQNAPTDLPNAIGQDKQAQKIIHNGHLYILRDGNVYNGNGQIVK